MFIHWALGLSKLEKIQQKKFVNLWLKLPFCLRNCFKSETSRFPTEYYARGLSEGVSFNANQEQKLNFDEICVLLRRIKKLNKQKICEEVA